MNFLQNSPAAKNSNFQKFYFSSENVVQKEFRCTEKTLAKITKIPTSASKAPSKTSFCINRVSEKILPQTIRCTEKFCLEQNGNYTNN